MYKIALILGIITLGIFLILPAQAQSVTFYVSAENSDFNNIWAGPMVIELVVDDPNSNETGETESEPTVDIDGNQIRMAQGTDGRWYAYIADLTQARTADELFTGSPGDGLDFGQFCAVEGNAKGLDLFTEADGLAIAGTATGSVDGSAGSLTSCTDVVAGTDQNVVRKAKDLTNSSDSIPTGQIDINEDVWPIIQLFDLTANSSPEITMRIGSTERTVVLHFNDSEDVASLLFDREIYPRNAEVGFILMDPALNIDPTDNDTWTWDANPNAPGLYYYIFDDRGAVSTTVSDGDISSGSNAGVIDISSNLSDLKFGDNGILTLDTDATGAEVVKLDVNPDQPTLTIFNSAGVELGIPITIVETRSQSGIFTNTDGNDSNLQITSDAPRGQHAILSYDDTDYQISTGSFSAGIIMTPEKPEAQVDEPEPIYQPLWVENLESWFTNGAISETEFDNAIAYLIEKGIILNS